MNDTSTDRQLWVRGVAVPEVHVFRAPRPDGSSLLSLPGGGYHFLSVQNEGLDVAERFNAERTTVFVLTYRLPGEGWANPSLVALCDAQRAMRVIRSRAADFRIDPARLGVLGFSAGGHLAADLGVSFDEATYKAVDAADRLSARPAFLGLVYPVTRLKPLANGDVMPVVPAGSPASAFDRRSPVMHVRPDIPPSFVVHAVDDSLVPVDNSLDWLAACRAAKVSCEAHILAQGDHGFGLQLPRDNPGSRWPDLFALWMRKHGGDATLHRDALVPSR